MDSKPVERPILFSAPMVRAILAGNKTQTRRIIKAQPGAEVVTIDEEDGGCWLGDTAASIDSGDASAWQGRCPYGKPGDRLWVRETWYCDHMDCINKLPKDRSAHDAHADDSPLLYRADGECCEQIPECDHSGGHGAQWRPSIHMPRWASRITLEVTGIRAERLNDISEADARAEGIEIPHDADALCDCGRRTYRDLWDRINGQGSWLKNPWVWVVSFKRGS